jgi:bifunctional non-homologous end joining protein LigD
VFAAFDFLLDEEPIIDQLYADRRRALEALHLPAVVVTPSYPWDDAAALLAACEDTGMEGVMLKRRDSPYVPGRRTDAWRKVKCPSWREQAGRRFAR